MTVDELMGLLEAVPYYTEVRMAVKTDECFSHEGSVTGLARQVGAIGRPARNPKVVWLICDQSIQPLSAQLQALASS